MRIVEYLDAAGRSPFTGWFDGLDSTAAAKVTVALTRIELGNLSNVKTVGGGVLEHRIDFGPGYRIYFGRHGDELVVLENVNLTLRPGEIVGLLGRSGSGKSTLLRLISGLDEPSAGAVSYMGKTVSGPASGIAMVFQSFALFPWLTVLENVAPVNEIATVPFDPREALSLVGLEQRLDHFPSQLSGGEQQRVAVARAIAKSPDVLLCDEPTGALDTATGNEIMALFERLHQQGNTIVLVTHEHDIAMHAHRIVHIRDGKVERDERIK